MLKIRYTDKKKLSQILAKNGGQTNEKMDADAWNPALHGADLRRGRRGTYVDGGFSGNGRTRRSDGSAVSGGRRAGYQRDPRD